MHRRLELAALLAAALLLAACGEEQGEGGSSGSGAATGPMARGDTVGQGGVDREAVLGPFLAEHWKLPIPAQGTPPADFSPLEADLAPEACGACHPQQLAQWKTSLHAAAYSPGFAGQLIEGSLAAPAQLRNCQTCHTPLEEQQPVTAAGSPAPEGLYDPELRAQGIVCASCHVREHQRFGPPRRTELPPLEEPLPHGGFEVRTEFQEARFCATCHQFWNDAGIEGKPIQNTFVEWRTSRHAEEGRTCQSCHMPDRKHLWRGIHDPEMVRGAVDVELAEPALGDARVRSALVVHNRGVGHAFPTYVTPRVFLAVWQEADAGVAIEGTRVEATVGREVDFSTWTEVFDTRILPDQSMTLDYDRARAPGARSLVARVTVDPDHHYRGLFGSLRNAYDDPEAREMMEEAYRRTTSSAFVLEEIRRPLP